MPIEVLMPALSPTMEKGNLAKWVKNEGDSVKAGDVIAEIETDKATMEVEAVDEGVLAKIAVPAGTEGVKVNTVIAVLADEGEVVCFWAYANVADTVRGLLASAGGALAVSGGGREAAAEAVAEAVRPFVAADGSVRMRNVFRWVSAR